MLKITLITASGLMLCIAIIINGFIKLGGYTRRQDVRRIDFTNKKTLPVAAESKAVKGLQN